MLIHGRVARSSWIRAPVPSGDPSSTKSTSTGVAARTSVTRATSVSMFSISLYVGTTTTSCACSDANRCPSPMSTGEPAVHRPDPLGSNPDLNATSLAVPCEPNTRPGRPLPGGTSPEGDGYHAYVLP